MVRCAPTIVKESDIFGNDNGHPGMGIAAREFAEPPSPAANRGWEPHLSSSQRREYTLRYCVPYPAAARTACTDQS